MQNSPDEQIIDKQTIKISVKNDRPLSAVLHQVNAELMKHIDKSYLKNRWLYITGPKLRVENNTCIFEYKTVSLPYFSPEELLLAVEAMR